MAARYTLIASFLFFCFALPAQNGALEVFGKNRVQFHEIFEDWSQYETEHFLVYWYGEGRYIGQIVVQMAEHELPDIQEFLNHQINDKIEILVYTDISDLKQSNLGEEEIFEFGESPAKIIGNKIFVYYEGSYEELRLQLRRGIAGVYLNSLLFGSNFQEMVQNVLSMDLPAWFSPGLIAYVAESWNTRVDEQLRGLILSGETRNFDELSQKYPQLAGHALWHFVGINHNAHTVSNLLYLSRINRSAEQGFRYVLGSDLRRVQDNCFNYFNQRYQGEIRDMDWPDAAAHLTQVPLRNKKNYPLYQIKADPTGRYLAYATNNRGKIRVWLQDLQTGKRKKLLQKGHRMVLQSTDYNYPLLAWSRDGRELGIIYEQRDLIKLERHVISSGEVLADVFTSQYQRIFSFDYFDEHQLLFTAAVRGFTDVFLYHTKTRQTERITQDPWDDRDACLVYLDDRPGILFASNRPDSILRKQKLDSIPPHGHFDLFYLDLRLQGTKKELIRLTHTPNVSERAPLGIDRQWFAFISDESGIANRYYGRLEEYIHHYERVVRLQDGAELYFHPDTLWEQKTDSTILAQVDSVWLKPIIKRRAVNHPATNYASGIREHALAGSQMFELFRFKHDRKERSAYRIFYAPVSPEVFIPPRLTLFRKKTGTAFLYVEKGEKAPYKSEEKQAADSIPPLDFHYFQSEFEENEMEEPATRPAEQPAVVASDSPQERVRAQAGGVASPWLSFRPGAITPYRLRFKVNYVDSRMSNEPLFEGLNSFVGVPQRSAYVPSGLLIKANFKDVLEDHVLEIGTRPATGFNGVEFYTIYDDKRRRIDRRYVAYYRQQRFSIPVSVPTPLLPKRKATTFLLQSEWRYPFSTFSRIQATLSWRIDNTIEKASDPATLNIPVWSQQYAGLRLSHVFDNTIPLGTNLLRGLRSRIYVEGLKGFAPDFTGGFNLSVKEGFTGVAGVDARYYQLLFRKTILALRLAGNTSFGSEKILYYLGGTENWLFPSFNADTPMDNQSAYAWQLPTGNLRGFDQNIRNGNSYVLFNAELRWPLFRFFFPNIRGPFWRDFQLVGFFDIGTAWAGKNPFAPDSPLNTRQLPDPPVSSYPVQVVVHYYRNPLVLGYGAGVRLPLFGYFLRIDYARGLETGTWEHPRLYLALGYDF